jgi:hypothetical protein
MDWDWTLIVLPFVVAFAMGFGLFVVFWQRAAVRRQAAARRLVEPDLGAPPRDGKGRGRWRRRGPQMDPRSNGHARRG